jgi:hypothetical protein
MRFVIWTVYKAVLLAPKGVKTLSKPGKGWFSLPKRTKLYDGFEVVVLMLKDLDAKTYPPGVSKKIL